MTPITTPSHELDAPPESSVMAQADGAIRPLVDHLVIERLRKELEDGCDSYTSVFVANFIDCLPHRIQRLRLALTTGDWEGSFDAVLSLKTSSQMVGAEQLAFLAMKLESELRSDATLADVGTALPHQAATFLGPINQCSRETVYSLTRRQVQL
jgi:HPt (histidine-containing phosphotransfer) domain-containing protein